MGDKSSMEVDDGGWNIVKKEVLLVEGEQQKELLLKVLEVEASEGHWVPSECLARLQAVYQPERVSIKITVSDNSNV